MTELAFIYAVVAAFLLGMGLIAGPVISVPVPFVLLVAITWPAIALYMLANLVAGHVAGFCWALWKLMRGEA